MKNHELFQSGHAVLGPLFQTVIEISCFEFGDELFPINIAIAIGVNSLHDHVNLSWTQAKVEFSYGVSELNRRDEAIAILIKLLKDVLEA